MKLIHTEEFDTAFRFVTETNRNIFLTGKAGTGKTTFLKYLRQNSIKKTVVAAPTGVAAINARGVTLHSLFQLPFGIIPPQPFNGIHNVEQINRHPLLSKVRYRKEKLDLLRGLELLIIDEASMVASYIVDAVDTILRYVRNQPHFPFGGVQVLFIGDLYQLPPVVKRDDWEILQNFYNSVFFFDSIVLRNNQPVIIELKEIFRQRDDKFIEILNGIRNNNISQEDFELLNSKLDRDCTLYDTQGYITLTTHNYQADEINRGKLNDISGRFHSFFAEVSGEFPEKIFPAEETLKLKVGAQVMFLKNDTEGRKYFNGKIGVVTKLDERNELIKVKCEDDYDEIEVKQCEWPNINYKYNPDTREITEEVIGSFVQFPLRLAWAITIHKSQGLTFDKVIIDAERAFATGQVYVALSRCTSLEGLVLRSPVYRNFLGAHGSIKSWQYNNRQTELEHLFLESRREFILRELQNIFTWTNWYDELKGLQYYIKENQSKVSPDSIPWLTSLIDKQKELSDISEKFNNTINRLSSSKVSIEDNDALQKKIKDGANYFYNEIKKWQEKFINHPLSAGTKKISGRIDDSLNDINLIVQEILYKVSLCKEGFSLENYLVKRKYFTPDIKQIRSSYDKKVKPNTVEETIRLFKEGKSVEEIAEERELTTGTIEGHLAKAVKKDLVKIEEIMPPDEVEKIASYFPDDLTDIRLSEIKEKAGSEISYGKLRLVLAWLQKKND